MNKALSKQLTNLEGMIGLELPCLLTIEILIHWRILRYTANSLGKLKEYQTVCTASKCVPTNYLQISKAGIMTYCDVLANTILIT